MVSPWATFTPHPLSSRFHQRSLKSVPQLFAAFAWAGMRVARTSVAIPSIDAWWFSGLLGCIA